MTYHYYPNNLFNKKTVVITGGGRGIGRALALAFAEFGATVVVVARTKSDLQTTAQLDPYNRIIPIVGDIASATQVDMVFEQIQKLTGRIDILVNNAGIQGPIGLLEQNPVDDWIQTIQINLIGSFLCCRAVLPAMRAQGSGIILMLSGGGATSVRPFFSAYSASKAGCVRLTETLAEELRGDNIRVNALAPGIIDTDMLKTLDQVPGTLGTQLRHEVHKQLLQTPSNLARMIDLTFFLTSDASSPLTGRLISAAYDKWDSWSLSTLEHLMQGSWYTLRRIDPYTLQGLNDSYEQ